MLEIVSSRHKKNAYFSAGVSIMKKGSFLSLNHLQESGCIDNLRVGWKMFQITCDKNGPAMLCDFVKLLIGFINERILQWLRHNRKPIISKPTQESIYLAF